MKVKMTGKMILMKSKCSSGMREYTFVYHDMNEVSKEICVRKTCLMLCGEELLLKRREREKEREERKKKEERKEREKKKKKR